MPIRQLQVANDSLQDRLLLRIGTAANEEIRLHLTRRFLREIWPHLTAMLAGHLSANSPLPSIITPSGEPSTFDQPFIDDNPLYPLGYKPLLVTEAVFDATGEGLARLALREGRERSFNLDLNGQLLQALCAMLRAASDQAQWDLGLAYEAPAELGRPPVSAFLH
jgi:hypothetical protein